MDQINHKPLQVARATILPMYPSTLYCADGHIRIRIFRHHLRLSGHLDALSRNHIQKAAFRHLHWRHRGHSLAVCQNLYGLLSTNPYYSAATGASTFSTFTAENLSSGIFPNGSRAEFVRMFAAAST